MSLAMRRVVAVVAAAVLGSVAACDGTRQAGPVASIAAPVPSTSADAPLRAGERFLTLAMPRPYSPSPPNGGTDEYRCFLLDPKLAQPIFITASQFFPFNADIVHHAILFRVPPGDVGDARALDAAAPGDGWTCFGGTGIGAAAGAAGQLRAASAWIGAWAPGTQETLLAARAGYLVEPGSQIVMQVHYSLLATGGRTAPDRSAVRLRVADGTANLAPLRTTLVPAPVELPCASSDSGPLCDRDAAIADLSRRFGPRASRVVAGLTLLCNGGKQPKPGPTQHCDLPVRQAGTIQAVAGHMHLLGRSIKVELNPGKANAKILLNVPLYDFDDQGARPMATPVTVKPNDTLRVTCTHDATLREKLPELQPLQPRYVVWGEGTSDEMCLAIIIMS